MHKFGRFYNTKVKIISPKTGGGYSDGEEYVEKNTILSDVQPYSGTLEKNQFGFSGGMKKKIYFDNAEIIMGDYAMIGDIKYRVIYVEKRMLGGMAVLEEVTC